MVTSLTRIVPVVQYLIKFSMIGLLFL